MTKEQHVTHSGTYGTGRAPERGYIGLHLILYSIHSTPHIDGVKYHTQKKKGNIDHTIKQFDAFICSWTQHCRRVLQNGQEETPKASPNKQSIMEYTPPFWSYGTHPFFPNVQTISICTLWSTILDNSLSIPALLRTTLFLLTLSIRDTQTKCLTHFISRTFTLLLTALYILYTSVPLIKLLLQKRHFFTFIPNPLMCSTLFSTPNTLYTSIHCGYHIPYTTSIHCHLRTQVLKTNHFL